MSTVTKPDGSEFVIPEDQKEKTEKAIAIVSDVFHTKATDGKIVNAQVMKVYFDLMDAYQEAGVTTEEDVEDLKLLQGDFQTVVEACDANNDGFIDFEEFKNLIKASESAYVRTLFKTYDLNMDGYITQDEMNTVVAGIEIPVRKKRLRELFDMLLANFDTDGDGRLSLAEFSDSMKTLKW